jgi:hypothetical protein
VFFWGGSWSCASLHCVALLFSPRICLVIFVFGLFPDGVNCISISYAPNKIYCEYPEGEGTTNTVAVESFGRFGSPNNFAYDVPLIGTISPGCGPTTGAFTLTLVGTNFGLNPAVTVDGIGLTVTSRTHSQVEATMYPGQGKNLPVQVTVAFLFGSHSSPSLRTHKLSVIRVASFPRS